MAAIVLTNASITVNAVDVSTLSNSVEITYEIESVETTSFGGNRSFIGGLQNNSVTIEMMQDFAATKTEATIFPLVGTTTTLVFKPTTAATSVTNPTYTISGAYLSSHTPISATVGELAKTSLTFSGGTLVKTTV